MNGFSFLTPSFLALAPLGLALLVLIYRRKGTSEKRTVSSLFLLRRFTAASPARRRFLPPLTFWIELAAIGAVATSLAGLSRTSRSEHVALILDNSLSMASRTIPGGSETLLDVAKEQAQHLLASASADSTFELISPAAPVSGAARERLTRSQAAEAVRDAPQGTGEDRLSELVDRAMKDPRYTRFWIFSDYNLELSDDAAASGLFRTTSVRSGASRGTFENVALDEVSFSDTPRELRLSISAFTTSAIDLEAEVALCTRSSCERIRKRLTIGELGREDVVISLPAAKWDWIEARITEADRSSSPNRDRIRTDDEWYLTAEKTKAPLSYVGDLSLNETGLSKIPWIDLRAQTLSEFEAAPAPPPGAIIIYHRTLPTEWPERSAIFVFPPPNTNLQELTTTSEVQRPVLTRWLGGHPLTTHVRFEGLEVPIALPLGKVRWMDEVLSSSAGPLMLAGEHERKRFASVGMELLPYEGGKSLTLSVLTLNLLRWITGDAAETAPVPGSYVTIPAGTTRAAYVSSSRSDIDVDTTKNGSKEVRLNQPGVVAFGGDSFETFISVNRMETSESNILEQKLLTISGPLNLSKPADPGKTFEKALSLLALAFLLLDVILRLMAGRA